MMGTNASVAAVVAVVVSLMVEWFPGVRVWWERFSGAQKQGIMAALVAVLSLGVVGVNCARGIACPADWWGVVVEVVLTFLTAAAAQQGVHLLTRRE